MGPLLGHGGVVERLRDRSDGIDGPTHGQLQAPGVSQGEIDGATGAVGRWGGGVLARRGPKTTHVQGGLPPPWGVEAWVHPAPVAFLPDGMVHHEGLDGHGTPRIEHGETPLDLVPLQGHLGLEKAIHDPLA